MRKYFLSVIIMTLILSSIAAASALTIEDVPRGNVSDDRVVLQGIDSITPMIEISRPDQYDTRKLSFIDAYSENGFYIYSGFPTSTIPTERLVDDGYVCYLTLEAREGDAVATLVSGSSVNVPVDAGGNVAIVVHYYNTTDSTGPRWATTDAVIPNEYISGYQGDPELLALMNRLEAIYNQTLSIYNQTQDIYNQTQGIYNDTQGISNDTSDLFDQTKEKYDQIQKIIQDNSLSATLQTQLNGLRTAFYLAIVVIIVLLAAYAVIYFKSHQRHKKSFNEKIESMKSSIPTTVQDTLEDLTKDMSGPKPEKDAEKLQKLLDEILRESDPQPEPNRAPAPVSPGAEGPLRDAVNRCDDLFRSFVPQFKELGYELQGLDIPKSGQCTIEDIKNTHSAIILSHPNSHMLYIVANTKSGSHHVLRTFYDTDQDLSDFSYVRLAKIHYAYIHDRVFKASNVTPGKVIAR